MKRFFGNLIDILCLASCGIFACIVTKTVPTIPEDLSQLPLPLIPTICVGVALLLMLIFNRLTKLVWNVIYCLTTVVAVALLLEWVSKGDVFPAELRGYAAPYTLPALLEGGYFYELISFCLLWIMSALCCHNFRRVTVTAVVGYCVWLILALALKIAVPYAMMSESFSRSVTAGMLRTLPWLPAAFAGLFMALYMVMMSMYDALFMDWPRKAKPVEEAAEGEEGKEAAKTEAKPAAKADAKPAVTRSVTKGIPVKPGAPRAAKVVPGAKAAKLAKPVVATAAAATAAKPAAPAEEKKVEEKPAAPAEEKKVEEKPAAPAEEKKAEEKPAAPAEEKKVEEKPAAPAEEKKVEEKPAAPAEEKKVEEKPADSAQ